MTGGFAFVDANGLTIIGPPGLAIVISPIPSPILINATIWSSSCSDDSVWQGGGTSTDVVTGPLHSKFPCADDLIVTKLIGMRDFSMFIQPFLSDLNPNITYQSSELAWNSYDSAFGITGYTLGNTQSSGISSTVTLNLQMLTNSSQLLIAATVIHETLHAYINYNVVHSTTTVNSGYADYGSWFNGIYSYYLINPLPANYSNHSMMLNSFFDQAVSVLSQWDNNGHTTKEYAMAMLYGLNTIDKDAPSALKTLLDTYFQSIENRYNVVDGDLNTFYNSQLNSPLSNRLPTSGCN